jgi:UDP-N-acetylglucosamine acyltransferase
MPIHPTAIVHPSARIDPTAEIGAYAHVGEEAQIGERCVLAQGAYVAARVTMGAGNVVGPYAVIGSDPQFLGFDASLRSGVRIGDNNVLREHCTIHRSIYPDGMTVLGNNNYLMVSAHLGHDCQVGNHVVMVNYAGISGHVIIEDRVFISGHVGVHQYCRLGRGAMIGGLSGVNADVPPYTMIRGDFAFVAGLNIVGMRRAGVSPAARMALRKAYKTIFRAGLSIPRGVEIVRAEWADKPDTPAELLAFLDFLEQPSKRGVLTARSRSRIRHESPDAELE